MASERLITALRMTYEVMNQAVSDLGLAAMASDLSAYAEPAVLEALGRCRRELRRLTLADILDRLPGGHPGPDEAWAIVAPTLDNEAATIVWTPQIAVAFAVARTLGHDHIAARKAFQEAYVGEVGKARAAGIVPKWSPSLGWDVSGREASIIEAVARGRLSLEVARRICPELPAAEALLPVVKEPS